MPLTSEAKLAEDLANNQKDLAILKNKSTFHGLLKGNLHFNKKITLNHRK